MRAVGDPVAIYAPAGDGGVPIVHGARAFRDRVPGSAAAQDDKSTTVLGSCYATVAPPGGAVVNEVTLLPAVLPWAPAERVITCDEVFELAHPPVVVARGYQS